MRLSLVSFAAAAALAACSPSDAPAEETVIATPAPVEAVEAAQGSVLEVTDAFVMLPAPGRDVSGGGLTLTVTGAPMKLVGATTDIAGTVELHTMSMEDGVMQMRQVEAFDVTEETPLELKRGGNHLMFFTMRPDLVAGETAEIVLTLTDADGAEQTLVAEAEIRDFGE